MKKIFLVYAALLFTGLLIVYSPVVFDSGTLGFDDPIVVEPIRDVHSFSDYQKMRSDGLIWDVQPVRDLSLWLNSNHTGNLVIWFVISLLVGGCLWAVRSSAWIVMGLTTLFAFNPVFVSSVAWLSARKHILSVGFAIALTLVLLMECRKKQFLPSWSSAFGFVILFLLAIFSQPINILWPFFAGIYVLSKYRMQVKLSHGPTLFSLAGLGASGLAAAYLNVSYYQGAYTQTSLIGKYTSAAYDTFFWKLWCFGRIYFQTLIPIRTPASGYDPLSWLSGAGIILFLLTIYILVRLRLNAGFLWLVGTVIAVLPILIKMTNVYAVDNYVLFAVFCVFMMLALILQSLNLPKDLKSLRIPLALFSVIAVIFAGRSYYLAKGWNNDFDLWKTSYSVEPTAKSAVEYGAQYLLRGEPAKAMALAIESKKYMGTIANGNAVLAKSIYQNPGIAAFKKIQMLNQDKNEWSLYYIAALYAADSNNPEACKSMQQMIPFAAYLEFQGDSLETMAAESLFFCQQSVDVAQEIIRTLKNVRRNKKWDEQKFNERAKQLGVLK